MNYPSVTQIIKASGMTPDYPAYNHAISLGKAVDWGSRFLFVGHRAKELDCDEQVMLHLISIEKWLDAMKPTIEAVQPELISEKYGIIGHPDLLTIDWVIDIKTGQKAKHYRLQTAAYKLLANESEKYWIQYRGCLYAQADGSMAKWDLHDNDADINAFLIARQIYQQQETIEKLKNSLEDWARL